VLLLCRSDVARLLDPASCIAAVERAFAELGAGRAPAPGALGHPAVGGGFHVKVASLRLDQPYFAAKSNGNFFGNPSRGLPRIQGVIVLADAGTGTPLAVMDSIEITALRTAATTAVAAKHLARPDSSVIALVGCGVQGRVHARSLRHVLPLRRVLAVDEDGEVARRFAADMTSELGMDVEPVSRLAAATRAADVVVTCTPARKPILRRADVRDGAFIAAVGADAEDKQEIDPDLFTSSAIVVDAMDQCAAFGDLHHALASGAVMRDDVRGDLAAVVARRIEGRRTDAEVVLFDSTGVAIEDVAAAAVVYERALATGAGLAIDLASDASSHNQGIVPK